MGNWTDSIQTKAAIIHAQMAAARELADTHGEPTDNVSRVYLALLSSLYEEEYPFARLLDTSDLVVRFQGPSVDVEQPAMTIVSRVFTDIRDQIRAIAKSIAGLTSEKHLRWPGELDPQLAGLAKGSLLVGIKVPDPTDTVESGQIPLPEVSDQIFKSVRVAVQSLSIVGHHIRADGIDEQIRQDFPDPAIRDAVMVAASRLAPTGKRGIDEVTFYGPERSSAEAKPLTRQSRRILNQALSRPVKVKGSSAFEGSVREIDLDARRFEIRGVATAMSGIRCVYEQTYDHLVRTILDARVRVMGSYETTHDQVPRLVQVSSIELLVPPQRQASIKFPES